MGGAEFAELARRYCALIETRETTPLPKLLGDLLLAASAAYASALRLPDDIGEPSSGAGSDIPMWESLHGDLQVRLGSVDVFTEVFHPYRDTDVVAGSLADSLADIYVDVRRGLELWDAGRANDAVAEWRMGLEIHWGHHALDVMRALHALQFDSDEHDPS